MVLVIKRGCAEFSQKFANRPMIVVWGRIQFELLAQIYNKSFSKLTKCKVTMKACNKSRLCPK